MSSIYNSCVQKVQTGINQLGVWNNDLGVWNNELEASVFNVHESISFPRLLTAAVTLTVKNLMHTTFSILTNAGAALTAGLIPAINYRAALYEDPKEYNALGTLYLIFLRTMYSDDKTIKKLDGKDPIKPVVYDSSPWVKKTKKLLKSENFGTRELRSRVQFAVIGLTTIIHQVILAVAGVIAGVGSLFLFKQFPKLGRFAKSTLFSTNVFHTGLHALRLLINPHAIYPNIRPPVKSDIIAETSTSEEKTMPISNEAWSYNGQVYAKREIAETLYSDAVKAAVAAGQDPSTLTPPVEIKD